MTTRVRKRVGIHTIGRVGVHTIGRVGIHTIGRVGINTIGRVGINTIHRVRQTGGVRAMTAATTAAAEPLLPSQELTLILNLVL
jgi:hypothetical protein